MVLIKLLIFTLTFYQLIVDLDAITCPKGHKVKRISSSSSGDCEVCPDGSFQPEENNSLLCRACTNCEKNRGSVVKQKCTKETDTKCECRGNFVAWDKTSSTCKCDIGFELRHEECFKCKEAHFSHRINSPVCREWKKCESGEKIGGTKTSDVICNELRINSTSYTTRTPPKHPPEGTHTQNMLTTTMTTTTTTTAPPGHKVTPKPNGKIEPSPNSNTGNHIGTGLIILGIIGLLLLTAVTCKLHNAPCVQRKPVPTNDSLCRRPVEESGDSSQSSSLKLNPGEP
ncbi:tumor necrosis factor receptor superfamily member 4 [Hippoglossus stenolepis]|uniref:tumor necrosis factor receptor superfamily member 4 n=1 Tax=Hippoglossus stenolepis TaxID=195615 RepID=UPI00159CA717|nr:tumor necrosis factor receptor superfamily member 4 [Hippoglossus stenolepis]